MQQGLSFSTFDDFLVYLPEEQQKLVLRLKDLILETIPGCTEKMSYNVPFYHVHTRVCYLWPAAIPWGNVPLEGVTLGFCQGWLLHDEIGYLDKGNRKQVYTKTFYDVKDIDADLVQAYLMEAALVNETTSKAKKRKP